MLITNVNTNQPGESGATQIYYQPALAGYNYSDSGRGSGISPGITPSSPTRMGGRKIIERGCYQPAGTMMLNGSNGPVTVSEEEEDHVGSMYRCYPARSPGPNELNPHSRAYNTDALNPATYLNRSSEGDLLDITPPSGFYDPSGANAEAGMMNGNGRQNQSSFGTKHFNTTLYPILGSPTTQNGWVDASTAPLRGSVQNGDMVGAIDGENPTLNGSQKEPFNYKSSDAISQMNANGQDTSKRAIPPRIYTASERIL
jgi:hypothetical protein